MIGVFKFTNTHGAAVPRDGVLERSPDYGAVYLNVYRRVRHAVASRRPAPPYQTGERRSRCRMRLDSVADHARSGTRVTCPRVIGQRTSWSSRSVNPECYWLVLRYFVPRQLKVRLHEDLHPHPQFEMWVEVRSADGEHLVNVQVWWCASRAREGGLCGVVRAVLARAVCLWRACAWRADHEVHHDASCRLVVNKFKIAMAYPEWRPFEIIGADGERLTGRHLARTAMAYTPMSASGRRVRARTS